MINNKIIALEACPLPVMWCMGKWRDVLRMRYFYYVKGLTIEQNHIAKHSGNINTICTLSCELCNKALTAHHQWRSHLQFGSDSLCSHRAFFRIQLTNNRLSSDHLGLIQTPHVLGISISPSELLAILELTHNSPLGVLSEVVIRKFRSISQHNLVQLQHSRSRRAHSSQDSAKMVELCDKLCF